LFCCTNGLCKKEIVEDSRPHPLEFGFAFLKFDSAMDFQ
jgi:hypothetical protein